MNFFKMHRPKQVIIVALLTSLFWFLFNIGLLYTYQGSVIVNVGQVTNQHQRLSSEVSDLPGNLNSVALTRGQRSEHDENKNNKHNLEIEKEQKNSNDNVLIKENEQSEHLHATAENTKQVKVRFLSDKFRSDNLKKKLRIENDNNNNDPVIPQFIPTKAKEVFDFDNEEDKRDPNGPGENGQAVVVNGDEKEEENNGFKKHAFNELASKKISLHRSIPDTRESG